MVSTSMFTTCMSLSVAVLMVRTPHIWIIIKCIMPDFDYIRKELLKNGVNKKLLWTEYLEECSQNGDDALMYSQFCYYIQQNEQKKPCYHAHPAESRPADRGWLAGIRQSLLIRIPVKLPKHGSLLVLWPTASMLLSKRSSMNNKSHGLPLMSICTSSLAALRRFWYQTMLLQQRTVNRVTNMSLSWLSPMRNWHSITTLLSFRPGYVPPKDKPTLPIVLINCCNPLTGRYAACTGINTESAQAKALIVIIPRDGIQSIMIKS